MARNLSVALRLPTRLEDQASQILSPTSLRSAGGDGSQGDEWVVVQPSSVGWSTPTPSSEGGPEPKGPRSFHGSQERRPEAEADATFPRVQSSSGSEVVSLGAGGSVESRQVELLAEVDVLDDSGATWYPVDSMELDAVLASSGLQVGSSWLPSAGFPALHGTERLLHHLKGAESTCSSASSKPCSAKEAVALPCMTLSSFLGEDVPQFPFERRRHVAVVR
mmetsp:Transcript_36856/g.84970  ORF Transcript_36856/g.84970 Transcript_36856/m.84970 type:complete len:221 (+) Transcript_36856:81-743(+)